MARITLNFHHYRHNLELLASKCGDMKKLMVVLKNNAYGHGISQMAPLAAAVGVRYAAVKDCAEGLKIEGLFERVLVLSDLPNSSACGALAFAIHSMESLEAVPSGTVVHLNIDTGMHRNGIFPSELTRAFEVIVRHNLVLEGVFTHFHSADVLGSDYFVQRARFDALKDNVRTLATRLGLPLPLFHACNSAGLLRHNGAFDDDVARVGISSYGYTDMPKLLGAFDLKPVLALWAKRMSTRTLHKGQKVGYAGMFEVPHTMVTSTYDVGYGDGLFRFDGTKEVLLQEGQPLLGRVSMDSFSSEGEADEVCVFSDASSMAQAANTITYEVLTRLSPWLSRVVIGRDE